MSEEYPQYRIGSYAKDAIGIPYTSDQPFGETAYPGDAGIDLPIIGEHILEVGESKDLPSGIRLAIPDGYYGRITGRSSALRKKGIKVHEGIIDSGFRGELFSYVTNELRVNTALTPADRVAQLIIQPVVPVHFNRYLGVPLPPSERGTRGFGSSDANGMVTSGTAYSDWNPKDNPTQYASDRPDFIPHDPEASIRTVYLAGPIDHAPSNGWRAEAVRMLAGYAVYDPWIEARNVPDGDPGKIFAQNMTAIDECDAVIANLTADEPGRYGFGTPIEIAYAIAKDKPVIVVHDPDRVGVYLRHYWQEGVVIVPTMAKAVQELGVSLSDR